MSKKQCIIFGTNSFAKMIRHCAEKYCDMEFVAYTVDRQYIEQTTFDDLPVVAFEDIGEYYPKERYSILMGLGYSKMNELRRKKFIQIKEKGYYIENFVHPKTIKDDTFKMGEGNIIFEAVVLGYNAKIGNGNIIWNGSNISHESIVGDFNHFSGGTMLGGKTVIKNNCFFGMGSVIRGDRIIEDYTLVGAGCFINKNTKPYGVYVPARSVCLEDKKSTDLM